MKKIILSAAILIAGFSIANAQSTSTASQTVTLTLANAINISLTSSTGSSFLFDDVLEYQNGQTNTTAAIFNVKSNRPWAVTVKSNTASFSGPVSPAPVMPSSVLGVRLAGGSTFNSLSTTVASLTTGARGNSSFTVDYNANPGFLYDAGTYTMSVVYTATQQ